MLICEFGNSMGPCYTGIMKTSFISFSHSVSLNSQVSLKPWIYSQTLQFSPSLFLGSYVPLKELIKDQG